MSDKLTRRQFVKESVAATAAIAAGMSALDW